MSFIKCLAVFCFLVAFKEGCEAWHGYRDWKDFEVWGSGLHHGQHGDIKLVYSICADAVDIRKCIITAMSCFFKLPNEITTFCFCKDNVTGVGDLYATWVQDHRWARDICSGNSDLMFGEHSGPHSGEHLGPHSDEHSGQNSSQHSGEHNSEHSGKNSSDNSGPHSGESDEHSGEQSDEHSDEHSSEHSGEKDASFINYLASQNPSLASDLQCCIGQNEGLFLSGEKANIAEWKNKASVISNATVLAVVDTNIDSCGASSSASNCNTKSFFECVVHGCYNEIKQ